MRRLLSMRAVIFGGFVAALTFMVLNSQHHETPAAHLAGSMREPNTEVVGGSPLIGVSPTTPKASGAQRAAGAPPEPTVRARVIDVATGDAVPSVTLAYTDRGGEQREVAVSVDNDGIVDQLPRSALATLRTKGGPWSLLPIKAALESEPILLYACREVRLVLACVLAAPGALPPAGTQFEIVVRRPASQTLSNQTPDAPGGSFWLQQRGAGQDLRSARLDDFEVLRTTVRLFADQGVMVSGGGYWSDLVPVPPIPTSLGQEDSVPEVSVRIPLKQGYRIEGLLADAAGQPVADAKVTLVVLRRVPTAEASALKKPVGAAQTMRWKTGGEYALVQTYTEARTDARGRFVMASAVDGRAFLYVHAKGYHQVSLDSPSLDRMASGLTLEVEAAHEGSYATMFWKGMPLPPGDLMVVTLGADLQYHFYAKVTEGGQVPTAWFERGQHYYLRYTPSASTGVRGHAKAELTWQGQTELHLERLSATRILLEVGK